MEEKKARAAKATDMAKIGGRVQRRLIYERAHQYAAEGKPIAWLTSNVLCEPFAMILEAMDIATLHMDNFGAICAVKDVATHFLDIAGTDNLPDTLCSYMRATYGHVLKAKQLGEMPPEAPYGGWPKPIMMVERSTYCDGTFKFFQTLARHYDVPVYHVDSCWAIPHKDLEDYKERFIEYRYQDLKGFVTFTEKVTGRKLDMDRLSERVARHEEVSRLWREIEEMRQTIPCPIPCVDFWAIIAPGFWIPGFEEQVEYFQGLHAEVKYRVENKMGAVPDEKYRLMWLELPPWYGLDMFPYFESKGAVFVIESYTYHQFLIPQNKPDAITDPLLRLAWEIPAMSIGILPEAEKESLSGRVQFYVKMAREWKVDGAVIHPLLTCRNSPYDLKHAEDALMRFLKIPSLRIQGDIVDKRAMLPFDQLKPQIDTFLETVDYYKRLRGLS